MNLRLDLSLDKSIAADAPALAEAAQGSELVEPELAPHLDHTPELDLDVLLGSVLARSSGDAREPDARGTERVQVPITPLAAASSGAVRAESGGLEAPSFDDEAAADPAEATARDLGFYTTPEDFWAEVVGLHEQLLGHPQLAPRAVESAIAWVAAGFRLAASPAPNATGPSSLQSPERLREFTASLSEQATRALLVAHEQRGSALRAAGGGKG